MNIRTSLLTGLAVLAAFGMLQGGAALLGSRSFQRQMATQAKVLEGLTHAASAQLAFERADRAAQASRGAANPARRRDFAELFRAETGNLRAALLSASALEPTMAALLDPSTEWVEQTDLRLPGSKAGPQSALLRDDLLVPV